jgi:hypothetical protein
MLFLELTNKKEHIYIYIYNNRVTVYRWANNFKVFLKVLRWQVAHVDRICKADDEYKWNVSLNLAGRLQVL